MSTGKVHSVNVPARTPAQIEFTRLFREVEKYGWKQADVARALSLSPPAVSTYLNGDETASSPSERTLKQLRQELGKLEAAKQRGEEIESRLGESDRLREQLDYLQRHDKPAFEAVKQTVDILHKGAIQGVSSTVSDTAKRTRAKASALARSESQSPSPSPGVGAPSAHKLKPKRGAGSGSSNKPPPAKQAPQ